MTSEIPRIEVSLRADRICYLSQEQRFSFVVLITLKGEKPITLVKDGNDFAEGIANNFSHSIECVDQESRRKIPVLKIPESKLSKTSRAQNPPLITLQSNRADYLTFTTATNPRDYEHNFNVSELQADRVYTLRCNALTVQWWSHDSRETILSYFASHQKLPPPSSPPLSCSIAQPSISFRTLKTLPIPPQITVSLTAPTTLSLSNNPPFKFTTTFTSHASQPITALAERNDILSSNKDIEILSASTRTPIETDLIDDGNMGGPWRREEFLRLEPGLPHVESRVLDPMKPYSDLADLEIGKEYILRLRDGQWSWWSEDSVDEVMGYAGDRDSSGLGYVPAVELVCHDEIKFRVVE